MEVLEEIQEVVNSLNKLDQYNDGLIEKLSKLDSKRADLLHYIEFNPINILWCYKMVKEIKDVSEERRKIKNDIIILNKFNEHKEKIVLKDNRQFLLNELYVRNKKFNKNFILKQYTEEELEKILGKGVANV